MVVQEVHPLAPTQFVTIPTIPQLVDLAVAQGPVMRQLAQEEVRLLVITLLCPLLVCVFRNLMY